MKTATINTELPTYEKTAADCLNFVRETLSCTHEGELSLAQKCIETQDKIITTCLQRLCEDDVSSEEASVLWEQVEKASNRQAGVHTKQIDLGRESRNTIVFLGGAVLAIGLAIAHPELAKPITNALGKGFSMRAPKALDTQSRLLAK